MTLPVLDDKMAGAIVSAAIGDALGWPNEFRAQNTANNKSSGDFFIKWTRKSGGRFWLHEETVNIGEYSDDTQMIIATARSLLHSKKWNTYFTKVELPYWLGYERGGGAALKRAARSWRANKAPWENHPSDKEYYDYYNAGGNGVAMRILPHVATNILSATALMDDVIRNGMYTHGHPRALVGATCYAFALWSLANNNNKLEYGQLIDDVISGRDIWGAPLNVSNTESWLSGAQKRLTRDYHEIWNETVSLICDNLKKAKKAITLGALDLGYGVLENIGCFDKKINGAGDVAAVSAIYLASKYASDPQMGIKEAVSLPNADTDTIASMTGALLGMIYGLDWIPSEWRLVQDYQFLINLAHDLSNPAIENAAISDYDKADEKGFVHLPIGKAQIAGEWANRPIAKNISVTTQKLITKQGQTLFFKTCARINNDDAGQIKLTDTPQNLTSPQKPVFEITQYNINKLIDTPFSKLTFNKVMKVVDAILNTSQNSDAIAKKFKIQVEYVEHLRAFIRQ